MAREAARPRPRWILPLIVWGQLFGTALWFAGNAVAPELYAYCPSTHLPRLGWFQSSNLGLSSGHSFFAFTTLADRYPAQKVFLASAVLGAGFNLSILLWIESSLWVLACRFATSLCLAGIYPVGMKLASSWYKKGLELALGWLVGALVIGTALPHLLRALLGGHPDPVQLLTLVSGIALAGGLLVGLGVYEGPHTRRLKSLIPLPW